MGFPDFLAELETVQIWQHHIQNGQIQRFVRRKVQRAGSVIGFADPKSLVLQIERHQVGDFLLVVHHENRFFRHRASPFRYGVSSIAELCGNFLIFS